MQYKFIHHMKKLGFVLLLVTSLCAHAQVTITQSNFPTAGTSVSRAQDTLKVEFDPGTPGTGNTWNYGGMVAHRIVNFDFVAPSGTPYASDYPTSNLAIDQQGLFIYWNVNNSMAEELGFAGDGNIFGFPGVTFTFKWNSPLINIPFPATYNTIYSDSAVGQIVLPGSAVNQPMIDSVKLVRHIIRNGQFDATGSLTVNSENFPNALRHKRTDNTLDSVFIKAQITQGQWVDASSFGAPPQQGTEITYDWFVNGHNFPVLTANMNAIGDSAITRTFYQPTTNKQNDLLHNVQVYPNPASYSLYIAGEMQNVHTVIFTNTLGQSFSLPFQQSANKLHIQTETLPNGIYSFQLFNKEQQVIHQGKIAIQK